MQEVARDKGKKKKKTVMITSYQKPIPKIGIMHVQP